MITVNNEPLRNFLAQQNSKSILTEFKHTTTCHAIYHPMSNCITQRKPYQRKATIITKSQVFFYYLNLLPARLTNKFHSLSAKAQSAIQCSFNTHELTSSKQAISTISNQLR